MHEWLTGDHVAQAKCNYPTAEKQALYLNEKLTELYGAPPIVRTYNGEKPEEFGLKPCDLVLYWLGEWRCLDFRDLDPGDKWILPPPAPKEDK